MALQGIMKLKYIVVSVVRCLQIKFFFLQYYFLGIMNLVKKISKYDGLIVEALLRMGGSIIGNNVSFKSGIILDNVCGDINSRGDFSFLSIGNNVFIGKDVFFDLANCIIIEDDVVISARVMLLTHQDCGGRIMTRWYPRKSEGIRIGKGAWIGVQSIIMPGVVLGECSVVGAGSLVLESVPAFSVVVGSPARIVKKLK